MPAPPAPPPPAPGRLFWANLVVVMLLAVAGTAWFGDHLKAYLTEAVVLGGGLTLWAALRLGWSLLEKLGKVDAAEASRRLLSTPETSLVLAVASVTLAVLWFTTGSLYFVQQGGSAGDREFVVQVTRQANQPEDRTLFIDDVVLSASRHLVGRPYFWPATPQKLDCVIVKPLRYEKRDCSILRGEPTSVRVPGDFTERSFHVLRIVPGRFLYAQLPNVEDAPEATYRLELQVGGQRWVLPDLRRRTLYAGGLGPEMPLVRQLDAGSVYEARLVSELRAVEIEDSAAQEIAAKLSVHALEWPVLSARQGQKLSFTVTRERIEDGKPVRETISGFPMTYEVTAERVQTLWIPAR